MSELGGDEFVLSPTPLPHRTLGKSLPHRVPTRQKASP
jgi:hypothetical protein